MTTEDEWTSKVVARGIEILKQDETFEGIEMPAWATTEELCDDYINSFLVPVEGEEDRYTLDPNAPEDVQKFHRAMLQAEIDESLDHLTQLGLLEPLLVEDGEDLEWAYQLTDAGEAQVRLIEEE